MAQVVGVHGIGWTWSSRAEIAEAWPAALRKGLENGRSPHADTFSFEPAYYGALYNIGPGKSAGEPLYQAADLRAGFELELLEELAEGVGQAASADGPQAAAAKGALVRSPQTLLNALLSVPYVGGATSSAFIRLFKQVHRYFEEPELRAAVRAEVVAAVRPDTRVVVAHSLGSVVAYEALWAHPEWRIDTLVTIGSPLGLRSVRKRLDAPGEGHPGLPPSVRRWVNVVADQDVIALAKRLKGRYGPAVEDFPVTNPLRGVHSADWYLQNLRTARAVGAALG
ncbi:antibiotic ABC transporter ATP-binding protein [Kitasatospora sp. NBC_01287]|uniref:alpha/beta fold hydrolase n=1 Tax=Kitasatospora sp. NBC_01287 TaxID=2903573 RepID=UPI00225ADAAD|nr:antibiotic ABC transporter ATP-binding protein [Kitasatospora sp. NBC_01287]MCX4750422.1 antibiotic ABC transporter ATP-binding protein [Kitasatospora sp. NBC_01287]